MDRKTFSGYARAHGASIASTYPSLAADSNEIRFLGNFVNSGPSFGFVGSDPNAWSTFLSDACLDRS